VDHPVPFVITTLEAEEWQLFRVLRLAALEDEPDAFSPTHQQAVGHDSEYWQAAARRFAGDANMALFVARPARGLMSAVVSEDGVGHIGAMWVDPEARGQGLGGALLDAGLDFLDQRGVKAIELSVTETNDRAISLYESRGFRLTGISEPLRPASPLANLFMRRDHQSPGPIEAGEP
jgi:ribosomal protein S18 acetylase RimI-like enzyme